MTLHLDAAGISSRTIDVLVTNAASQFIAVDDMRLRLTMTDMAMGENEPTVEHISAGYVRARCGHVVVLDDTAQKC